MTSHSCWVRCMIFSQRLLGWEAFVLCLLCRICKDELKTYEQPSFKLGVVFLNRHL